MTINIDKLDPQELDALIAAAAERKKTLHKERMAEVRNRLVQIAKDEGYTIEELFGTVKAKSGPAKGRKVAPKYCHPKDPELTWTGRGKRPRWLQELLNSGKKLEELEIR